MDKYRILVKGILKYEDKYLVVRRWYDDRVSVPYQWEFIDGAIEFAEDPDKAVLRHIYEQARISAVIDKLLYTWSFTTGEVFNIGISYLCATSYDNVVMSEDLVNYRWISRDEFDGYIGTNIMEDIDRMEQSLL